ncbi:MAG: helix-turn-helix domain-containing protein [Croceibacterium sp.]
MRSVWRQKLDPRTAIDGHFESGIASRDSRFAGLELLTLYDEAGNLRRLRDIERDVLRLAIENYTGQRSELARRLGISRSSLYRKLDQYQIK